MLLAEELEIDLHADRSARRAGRRRLRQRLERRPDHRHEQQRPGRLGEAAHRRRAGAPHADRRGRSEAGASIRTECRADDGRSTNARGNSLRYGELAAAAAKLPVPKDVKLKPAATFGSSASRSPARHAGQGRRQRRVRIWTCRLPGMLYAAIALCPTVGGTAAAVDSAAAEALPGVRRVLSTSSGVVVVADHFWQALQGAQCAEDQLGTGRERATSTTPPIWASLNRAAVTVPGLTAKMTRGDTASALKRAEKTLSAVYELPLLAHATMEPMNCTADVQRGPLRFVRGHSGAAGRAGRCCGGRRPQARPGQRPHDLLGGGFGRRLEVDFVPAAVEASKALGAPVKLDLDARGRHDPRLLPAAGPRRGQRRLRRPRQAPRLSACTSPVPRSRRAHHPDGGHRSVRFGDRVRAEFSVCGAEFPVELLASGNRHRRGLHALGQPCAELLRHRVLHR